MKTMPYGFSGGTDSSESTPRRFATNPYIITIGLIGINLLVFLAMVASGASFMHPTPREVLPWGADFGPLTIGAGQWWRLLAACFVHFGVLHIAMNMYVLFQIGPFIEMVFGRVRYLLIYFFAGLSGSMVSLWIHPLTTSAGASGAIFGLYGAVFGFLLMERRSLDPAVMKNIGRSAGIFLVYNMIYGATSGTTDLSAHVGGLVAGFVAGVLLVRPKPSGPWRVPAPAALTVLTVILAAGIGALAERPGSHSPGNGFIATLVTGSSVPLLNGGKLVYTGEVTAAEALKIAASLNGSQLGNVKNVLALYSKRNGKATLSLPLHSRSDGNRTARAQSGPDDKIQPWNNPYVIETFTALGQQLLPVTGSTSLNVVLLNSEGVPERTITVSPK